MGFQGETCFGGKRMDVKEKKEEGDRPMLKWKPLSSLKLKVTS